MRGSLFTTTNRSIPQLRKLYAKLVVYNENIVVAKKIYQDDREFIILKDEDSHVIVGHLPLDRDRSRDSSSIICKEN